MPNKSILCYIYTWDHGSFQAYYLVGGLVPRSSGDSGLAVSIHIYIGQALVEPLRGQPC
ncbi:hypothetical protein T11_12904 [Trichinella zimbabwensis]|uniref:Uncharacterized protein n=1 Tax=Trichinella zimbabwensis TaxID=268475 RepID=A0A0V1FWK6_9BILA|nr:hypothetical protein T11_12904 [Trichinella zimbabwensis]